MQLEVTIYCLVFITRYSNNNTKCYPKQWIGMQNTKTEQNFHPGLTLIDISGTGPWMSYVKNLTFHQNVLKNSYIALERY